MAHRLAELGYLLQHNWLLRVWIGTGRFGQRDYSSCQLLASVVNRLRIQFKKVRPCLLLLLIRDDQKQKVALSSDQLFLIYVPAFNQRFPGDKDVNCIWGLWGGFGARWCL